MDIKIIGAGSLLGYLWLANWDPSQLEIVWQWPYTLCGLFNIVYSDKNITYSHNRYGHSSAIKDRLSGNK